MYLFTTFTIGTEQIDSNSMMDVSSSNVVQSLPNTNDDTNMLELNTPLNTLQFSEIEQQFANRSGPPNVQILPSVNRTNESSNLSTLASDDTIMGEPQNSNTNILMHQANRQQHQLKHYSNTVSESGSVGAGVSGDNSSNLSSTGGVSMGRQNNNDFPVKKGRISKSSQRPFR